ncbi:MAG: hypothetical protein J6T59_00015 [Bacteroidales bacterium]|nr:hypothetical protein [Bacteroidales bacterium]MBO7647328.1 hypothetical protein [Bacteroidales bacterium]
MSNEIEKITDNVTAASSDRRPSRAWAWVLVAAVILALTIAVLNMTQKNKESYEYHFNVQRDTVEQAVVGLQEVSIIYRWTPVGGLFPKIILHGIAMVDGADVKYGQFVFVTDKDPVPTIVDPTRSKDGHYWVTLRDLPEGRIVTCRFMAVTKDGRKIYSDSYVFNTNREAE